MKQDDVREDWEKEVSIMVRNIAQQSLDEWEINAMIKNIMNLFTAHSTSLLQKMEKKKTKVDTFAGWTIHHDEGYNEGVSDCIAIVKEI